MNGVQVNGVQYSEHMIARRNPTPRHDRTSVVDVALRLLDDYGLPDLTMRRLAAALDVQPSALYWHFENKQTLLAAVADRIQSHIQSRIPDGADWREATRAEAIAIRDALLAYRDGADVVLSTRALGLGSDEGHRRLVAALERGHDRDTAERAATAILHLVFGDALLLQQRIQADSLGAVAADSPLAGDPDADFGWAVELLLRGLQLSRAEAPAETPAE